MQPEQRRGPLDMGVPPSDPDLSGGERGELATVQALLTRACGADEAAVAAMATAITQLQDALVAVRSAAQAKLTLATEVPVPLLRRALAAHSCTGHGDGGGV